MSALPRNRMLVGDAREGLAALPRTSQWTALSPSPPYYRLRDYQVDGQLGLEPGVDRVGGQPAGRARRDRQGLEADGSAWLNLGDPYSRHARYGAPPKSLLLGPERLVMDLVTDGWIVRNKVIWAKSNPQPSSVGDRLSATWEVVYFLTRQPAVLLRPRCHPGTPSFSSDCTEQEAGPVSTTRPTWAGPLAGANHGLATLKARGLPGHPLGKNPGDVWTLATAGYRGAHFAVFPERLAERPIRAACPEQVCTRCGQPWRPARSKGQRSDAPTDM